MHGLGGHGRVARGRVVGAFLAALTTFVLGGSGAAALQAVAQPVAVSDVRDFETARRYLVQTLPLYLAPPPSNGLTGTFEFGTVPLELVLPFQSALGVVDEAWTSGNPGPYLVAAWTTSEGSFRAPRPRFGIPAEILGDTFVILIEPSRRLELRAVVPAQRLATLRAGASMWRQEPLRIETSGS